MNITPEVLWTILIMVGLGTSGVLINTLRNFRKEINKLNDKLNGTNNELNARFVVHVSQNEFSEFKKSTGDALEELRGAYTEIAKTLAAHDQMLKDIKESINDLKKKN